MVTEISSVIVTAPVQENDSQEFRQATPVANSKATEKPSQKQVDELVHNLNKSMQDMGTQVSFSVDRDTKHVVIKVIDTVTKEVVRQIPPEEMLRVSENIRKLIGVRVDQTI
jgi:flagellar protein FlaG